MATWSMLKTEKMRNSAKQTAFGSYVRRSENASKPVPRDGKARRIPELRQVVSVPSHHVVVTRLEPGKASGLSECIGSTGKGKRRAFKATGGNGTRIKMGVTAENYAFETDLLVPCRE